jgi:hypothetical protein
MRSEMILVLKINGFLRSIDKRIGNPINNFNIMIKYVYQEIMNDLKVRKSSISEQWNLWYEYFSFKFAIFFMNVYYVLFLKWRFRHDIENADLNVLI